MHGCALSGEALDLTRGHHLLRRIRHPDRHRGPRARAPESGRRHEAPAQRELRRFRGSIRRISPEAAAPCGFTRRSRCVSSSTTPSRRSAEPRLDRRTRQLSELVGWHHARRGALRHGSIAQRWSRAASNFTSDGVALGNVEIAHLAVDKLSVADGSTRRWQRTMSLPSFELALHRSVPDRWCRDEILQYHLGWCPRRTPDPQRDNRWAARPPAVDFVVPRSGNTPSRQRTPATTI